MKQMFKKYLVFVCIIFSFTIIAKSEDNSLNFQLFTSNNEEKLFLYDNKQFVIEVFIEELCDYENIIFFGSYEIINNKIKLHTNNLISTYFDTHLSYLISDYYILEFDFQDSILDKFKLFKIINGNLEQVKTIKNKEKTFLIKKNKIISNSNGVDDSKEYKEMIETIYNIKSNKNEIQSLLKTEDKFRYYTDKDFILEIDSNLNIEYYFYTITEVVNDIEEFVYIKDSSFYDKTTKYANIKFLRINNNSNLIKKSSSLKLEVVEKKARFQEIK